MLFIQHQVRDHLFDNKNIGIDFVALNMQRGRDHGLPGYIQYKRICSPGETFNSFADLRKDMTQQVMDSIYDFDPLSAY